NLVDCKSENIFVDTCHLLQGPFLCGALDVRINIGEMITHAQDDFFSVFYDLGVQIALLGMTLQDLCWAMVINIIFVECLQCDHSRLSAYPWHSFLERFLAIDQVLPREQNLKEYDDYRTTLR